MFKISIEQIDADKQEEVVIKCHEMNDYVLSLVKKRRRNPPLFQVLRVRIFILFE